MANGELMGNLANNGILIGFTHQKGYPPKLGQTRSFFLQVHTL